MAQNPGLISPWSYRYGCLWRIQIPWIQNWIALIIDGNRFPRKI